MPPPQLAVADCMADLERFLHADDDGVPLLVRAGIAHLQFETIHPFLDGNGRVGRLLITALLCSAGVLRQPLLYLSLYLKEHRSTYYSLLDRVRRDGDWEAWLGFFLEGVRVTADGAVRTAEALEGLFRGDRDRIMTLGRTAGSALRAHEVLKPRPIASVGQIGRMSGLSHPAAGAAVDRLVGLDIAREITGRRRDRLFASASTCASSTRGDAA